MDRWNFIKTATILGASSPFTPDMLRSTSSGNPIRTEIYSFSKLFQFLDYHDLASLFKESGIDGIDLTVRNGGHVLPENVERDLPRAVKAAQEHGITIPSIVTDIADVNDPLTERVLKTAANNGIKYYRLAYYSYDHKQSVPTNLEMFKSRMEKLSEMNSKYHLHGGYQNHFGQRFGASPWEIWTVLKDLDKKHIGCFYDIHHGLAESLESWGNALRLISPYITMRYIKDFYFVSTEKNIRLRTCPLGEGMVDFNAYFRLCNELELNTPINLHVEYPLFNDDEKNMSKKDKYKKALAIMKRDTDKLKSAMIENNIV